MNGFLHRQQASARRGFAAIELLCVLVILLMLVSIASSAMKRVREKTYITIDLANLRQILKGSAIYNADNNDHMAHPTWGTIPSGPDGWAYITANQGRLPGFSATISSCEGRDVNSPSFTNQLAFFSKGQVTQYLEAGVKTAWCPKDVATRNQGRFRSLWLQRPVKVTSYSWSATVAGPVGSPGQNLPFGRTYKVSQFRGEDWLMWENDESDAFNFNDAADNPENPFELMSRRHSGQRNWISATSRPRNLPGGAVVGTFGDPRSAFDGRKSGI